MTEKIEKDFFSADDIATKLGVTRRTVYKWVDEIGFPRPYKIGHRLFWKKTEIEAYIESTRK